MSSFATSSADQPLPSRLKASDIGGKSAAPAPPPTLSSAKVTPPASSNNVKRMTRVKLNPTTRVASVSVSPALLCADAPQNNSFQYSSVLHAPAIAPLCASLPLSNDQQAVEAVQTAFEKTEAHLKAIEAKLNLLQEEMQRMASPAPSRETVTKAPGSNPTAQSFLSPLAPFAPNGAPGSKAAASHHLQPILPAVAAPLSSIPPVRVPNAAKTAKPVTLLATAAAAEPPVNTVPVSAKDHQKHDSPDPCFPINDANVLESPSDSSNSYSPSDADAGDSDSDAGEALPAGARQSVGEPVRPPAQAPTAAAESSGPSIGTAAAVRQGFGLKGVSHANAPPLAGATGNRRAVKFRDGDESATATSALAALPSPAASPVDKYSAQVVGETGEMMTVGRHFRRISDQRSTNADTAAHFSVAAGSGIGALDSAQVANGIRSTTRRQGSTTKHVRESFFAPIPRLDDLLPHNESGLLDKHGIERLLLFGAPCSWLCCAALAISYVSGVPTPVEKLLRANRMGVHYISFPTITLSELFDVVNDYIHTRYHRTAECSGNCTEDEFEDDEDAAQYLSEDELKQLGDIHCEMATFDKDVLDPESDEDIHGMGEHPPITNLTQLRKELLLHLEEENSMYIFNYNPHVLEQAQLRLRSNQCDTEEEAAAVMANARFPANASGLFGILLSFDPVKHEVKLRTPYLSAGHHPLRLVDEGEAGEEARVGRSVRCFASAFANLVMEEQTVSLQALYNSLQQVDSYSRLSRGFVRVFKSASFAPKVPSIFPLFVLDGSSAGGLMTSVLDVKIAPHVLGLAMLHHLSVTFLLTDSARRKQSSRNLLSKANVCDVKLRGIPLTKVCQQLRLPLSMIVCESNRSSIAAAYVWYHLFLQQLQISKDVHIGLILPSRREGAADGKPNITDSEFLNHLQLVVQSQSVMLISFDINIALNVRIDARREPAHFAIIIGVDEERGFVRLADVNVKRFRKTWHIQISRLYNAVMGYGYLVASKDKKVIKSLKGKQFHEDALRCARNFLPPPTPPAYQRFEYPSCPYPLTVLADAVERLGFSGTNVERFLNFCGFHISYFLSRDMPLEGAAFVIQNYSHYALDDAVSVTTTHYDFHEGNPPPKDGAAEAGMTPAYPVRSEADLLQAIQYAIAEPAKRKLIVKYDVKVLQANAAVWNGNEGSSFAFVMSYEAPTKMVVLSDASSSSFYRSFACPLTLLFSAVCSWDGVVLRGRGTLLLTTEVTQEYVYEDTKGYDMAHALVHHPFKPIFSAACSCLALASTEMMMNIATPTLLGGAPINFDSEKKKYKRYNNIFSAEDFLYALPSFSVCDWRVQSVDIQDIAGIANRAFATLRVPLRAVNVLPENGTDPTALLRACSGVSGLLTITLVTYDTGVLHGVPGSSAGLVNRVHLLDDEVKGQPVLPGASKSSVGFVQLLEGDPCRWGACFERSAEELVRAVKGIYRVEEVIEEGGNE
ncbi:hypothetical protein LSCM4_07130 [Leishmania orientalis]|uniref:Uncharacterized protein n=1 Tax=Leishmania orientalis TaxID=2249476 RepID=A0A836KXB7_9TRYP|nr:hypothetical protein LSCM4_07130 [Leishmania orientalis]